MKNIARTALFLAAALAAAASPAASPLDDAVARGAKFLLSHQAEDGHFSDPHMPALTALPLWALSGCAKMDGVKEKLAGGALRQTEVL